MKRNTKNNGFTLLEATIAMVLLTIAAAGILMPFGNAAAVQEEAARQIRAADLASELMEKTLTQDPNSLIGILYYKENEGAMLDSSGKTLTDSEYDGFSRVISCQPATVASVDLIAVTAVVYYEGNEITRLSTLVSR